MQSVEKTSARLNAFPTGHKSKRSKICQNIPKIYLTKYFRYSYSVATTLLDPVSICKDGSNAKDFAKLWKAEFNADLGLPLNFIKRFQQIASKNKVDIGQEKICERYVSAGVAVVKFQLQDSTVLQLKKHLRSTIGEVFASIGEIYNFSILYANNFMETVFLSGGTLGLFTGMSVISIFEIGFWVLRKPSKTSQGSAT